MRYCKVVSFRDNEDFIISKSTEYLVSTTPYDLIPNINVSLYRKLEEDGNLLVLFAIEDETVIGFSIYIISPNRHYIGALSAYNDVIYVMESYRAQGVAKSLIESSEEHLQQLGVSTTTFHLRSTSGLPETLGYMTEFVHTKYIGDR